MARTPEFTTKFRKDIKRLGRRGVSREPLTAMVATICEHGDAPLSSRPHNLSGDWEGHRECHIRPDWLLIYKVFDTRVEFVRTGTHSDLFR